MGLGDLNEKHRGDKSVVMAAVSQDNHQKNGSKAFQCASDDMKNDKEVFLAALNRERINLIDQHPDGKCPPEKYAEYTDVLKHAGLAVRGDRNAIMEALACTVIPHGNASLLWYISDELKNDSIVMREAVKRMGEAALQHASERLLGDKDFMLKVVKLDGCALQHAGQKLQKDKESYSEVAIEAIKRFPGAIEYSIMNYVELTRHDTLQKTCQASLAQHAS